MIKLITVIIFIFVSLSNLKAEELDINKMNDKELCMEALNQALEASELVGAKGERISMIAQELSDIRIFKGIESPEYNSKGNELDRHIQEHDELKFKLGRAYTMIELGCDMKWNNYLGKNNLLK